VRVADVMALLGAASQGALRGGWEPRVRGTDAPIIFDGLPRRVGPAAPFADLR